MEFANMRDLSKIVDQLGALTVSEAAQLKEMLEKRWANIESQKPGLSFNEGKACDAIVRRLEERTQATRVNVRSPEHDHHQFPVELAFNLGTQLFALEHTGIEPFEGHMKMEAEAEKLFAPITEALKNTLGTDALFELYVPINALKGKKGKELSELQNAIIAWVKETATTIPKRDFPDYRGNFVGPARPGQAKFDVRLGRFEPPIVPGRHFQIRHLVDDIEKKRAARIQAAIDKKFPKLAAWKKNEGARTVLVLEQNDIQLTNPGTVADAFLPIARERADRPDETYLIESFPSGNWFLCPILIDDRSYYDIMQTDEPGYWEFDPSKLADPTAR